MTYAIEVTNVRKRFARTAGYRDILLFWRRQYITALDDVTLQVPEGSVFGLLGANGAGKTTLLKVLAGLVLPDAGTVRIQGFNVATHSRQARARLVYIPGEERSLYWRLTGWQNMYFFALLNEVPARERRGRIDALLALVGLDHAADQRVMHYSTGMKQRLGIARGLLADPQVLLLDEPTRSLDPASARSLWAFIRQTLVAQQRKTVVVATHNMEEATVLCDQLAVLDRGTVRAAGDAHTVQALLAGSGRCVVTLAEAPNGLVSTLQRVAGVQRVAELPSNGHRGHSLEVVLQEPEVCIPQVVEHIVAAGGKVLAVHTARPSLGDAIAALAQEARR